MTGQAAIAKLGQTREEVLSGDGLLDVVTVAADLLVGVSGTLLRPGASARRAIRVIATTCLGGNHQVGVRTAHTAVAEAPGMPREDSHHRPADPPAGAPTELVGHRSPDGPEVYALSPDGVEQLQSSSRYGGSRLDWTERHLSMLELSHTVLVRVAGLHPSLQLVTLFAADVVMHLQEVDWVLDSRDVWRWIELMSIPEDWSAVDVPDGFGDQRPRGPFTGREREWW